MRGIQWCGAHSLPRRRRSRGSGCPRRAALPAEQLPARAPCSSVRLRAPLRCAGSCTVDRRERSALVTFIRSCRLVMCLGGAGAGKVGRGGGVGAEKSQGGFVDASGDDEPPCSARLTLSNATSAAVRTTRSEGRRRREYRRDRPATGRGHRVRADARSVLPTRAACCARSAAVVLKYRAEKKAGPKT